MESQKQPKTQQAVAPFELRRHPRFKVEVDIRVDSRTVGLVRGHTVDISESGISAILKVTLPVGEVVRLEFELDEGPVSIRALVKYQTAFRYGFQFVEPDPRGLIKDTCSRLARLQAFQ